MANSIPAFSNNSENILVLEELDNLDLFFSNNSRYILVSQVICNSISNYVSDYDYNIIPN
jgi:hypothetical protein